MKKFLLISIIAVLFNSCETEKKGNDGSLSPCKVYESLDLEMLNTYEEIGNKYKENDHNTFRKRLNMSQVYWVQYRDRFIKALFPLDKEDYTDQQNYSDCKCNELSVLTKSRIRELRAWLDGDVARIDCPTSIMQ